MDLLRGDGVSAAKLPRSVAAGVKFWTLVRDPSIFAELSMPKTSPKPFCFVLMPFSEDFDDVYNLGIKDACKAAGAYTLSSAFRILARQPSNSTPLR